nr:unnamed protein product [Spirometra erinaceieuropaei]
MLFFLYRRGRGAGAVRKLANQSQQSSIALQDLSVVSPWSNFAVTASATGPFGIFSHSGQNNESRNDQKDNNV